MGLIAVFKSFNPAGKIGLIVDLLGRLSGREIFVKYDPDDNTRASLDHS